MMNPTDLQNRLDGVLADCKHARKWSHFLDQLRVIVHVDDFARVMRHFRDSGMDMLVDVTAVDLLEYADATDRYRVVYQLLNTETGDRVEVNVHLNDPDPQIPSVTPIWSAGNWMEREAFDMFGIVFTGHPNPKRLLLPEEYASFPLRKDYPLKGRGERHNFPVITRSES